MFNQHWYVWLFTIFAILCFIQAGIAMTNNKATRMTWFLIMTMIWCSLSYYNWIV